MLYDKVSAYVRERHMIDENDYVVAGVSGGADSVCLLFMLCRLREQIPMTIHVVHINHKIRREAGDDAAYTEELCAKLGVLFTLVECDVEELAAARRISTEEAGRNVRYEAFRDVLEKSRGERNGKIAVAHNKNDCCETFLFNLFRGSSLKGLSGIQPVRGNIIRPLLCAERSEIEEFLDSNGIKYCIDSTNLEDNYTRNKIRHHILSNAVSRISPAAVSHIGEACARIGEAQELIADLTREACEECVTKASGGAFHIEASRFFKLHPTLQGYVVMETLARAAGSKKDLESVHVAQVKRLFESQCARRISLPYGLCAERDYTGILIYKADLREDAEKNAFEYVVSAQDIEHMLNGGSLDIALDAGGDSCKRLILSIKKELNFDFEKNIPQKKCTKWLDYDKIKGSVVVRCRQKGDYLTINAADGRICKKSLKSYFTDNKVPLRDRDRLTLVAEGSHVMWIAGDRISSFYKLDKSTKRVLELTYCDGAFAGNL